MRSKAAAVQGVAVRALRTAFPAVAVLAVLYALMLAFLNFMQALGNRLGSVAEGVERVIHVAMWDGPAVVPTLLGAFMLLLAYQLWMRKRAALVVLCGFVITQAVVDSMRGMSPGALIASIMIAVTFALSIKQFPGRPDPEALRKLKIAVPVLVAAFFATGVPGLFLMRGSLGLAGANAYALGYKSVIVAVGNSGLHFEGWQVLLKIALMCIALGGIAYILVMMFRPYRENSGQTPEDRMKARELVENYGSDSLAYFNTRNDKNKFFLGDDAFIAYKVVGDVAVASGDPVGPADMIPEVVAAFRKHCLLRGRRFAFLGASGAMMPFYEEAGMRSFSLGEETIVNVDGFTLEGRNMRKLRQSVNKISRMDYRMEFMYNASIPAHMKHDLARISADWRGGKQETGFSMGLGRLMSSEDPDCLLAVAYGPDGEPAGFLHFVPMYPRVGYSMDVHRWKIGTPGALSEFMIARTAQFLKTEGYRQMSLHFLAFAEHYREGSDAAGNPLWRGLAKALDHVLPIISVYHFDKKFNPTWKRRMLVYQGIADLVVVGIAAISAESALKITRPSHRQ